MIQEYRDDNPSSNLEQVEKLQIIDTLKAPIIEMGRTLDYEIIENYDLGAGPIYVALVFKPGNSASLPDMRIGFLCITEYSESSLGFTEIVLTNSNPNRDKLVDLIAKDIPPPTLRATINWNSHNPMENFMQNRLDL
jgi:hypothetical protein